MDELERLTKRVDELESLIRALLSGDERVIHLSNVPIANVVLGKSSQVTMQNCPAGLVFFGARDAIDDAESRLNDLSDQADDLERTIDELEDRLDNLSDRLDEADVATDELE